SKLARPVVELPLQNFSCHVFALPLRVIRILDWELRQRYCLTFQQAGVAARQFAEQNGDGPAINNDVMQHQQKDVSFGTEPNQQATQQGSAAQIERVFSLVADDPKSLGLAQIFRRFTQVDDRDLHLHVGQNNLPALAIQRFEDRTQRSMPPDDSL